MVLTGVEVAGLVLAVLPLLLPLLDEYKDGMKRTAIFFKRKKHVDKLAKALLTQRVLLAENVRTLLLRVEVDNIPEKPAELFQLLHGNDEIKHRIEQYLGKEAYTSYIDAVSSSERVVRRLIKGIDSFIPLLHPSKDDLVSLIEASHAVPTGKLELKTRAKLTLSYQDMESSIDDLNQSIILLERLHRAVSERHEVSANSTDRKAVKLASSLQIAREHAISLFNALVRSWNVGCHQEHEAKMYLEGTKILNNEKDTKSTYFKKQKPANFKLILSSKDTNTSGFWHENTIEVLDDNGSYSLPMPAATALGPNRPQVHIVAPVTISPGGTITLVDVQNLCTTIDWATRERKFLKFYLASQQKIQCQHEDCANLSIARHCKSVSLEDLLKPMPQTGSPVKMGLKNRMLLALNLASTLLQLQSTPWLERSWSKTAIEFLKRPSPAIQATPANTGTTHFIDYQHPVITQRFTALPQRPHAAASLPPKEALLELGIMLLEIWHETTLEAYYATTAMGRSGTPMPAEYWGRFMIASMWLDDPSDQPLPLYHTAISQCVKCFFGGSFSSPSWDDDQFRKALCKDLVEPLFESCKQWICNA